MTEELKKRWRIVLWIYGMHHECYEKYIFINTFHGDNNEEALIH